MKGYEASALVGIGVPKGTPAEIIEKLNKEINAVLSDPDVRSRYFVVGDVPNRALRLISASSSLPKTRNGPR